MTKPISTRVHGIIDYTWATAASSAAARLGDATSTARLLRAAAATTTASSLVTRFEGGALPLMPMKAHLAMDVLVCSALLASPLFLPAAERRYAAVPMLLGAMGLAVAMLTQPRSQVEEDEEFGGVFGGELATISDNDPDFTTSPYLRLHLE